MTLGEIYRAIGFEHAYPLGTIELPVAAGKTEERFVFLYKTSQGTYRRLLGTRTIEAFLDFVPTKRHPLLWLRLKVNDGSKGPSGDPLYLWAEFSLNIAEEEHVRRLRYLTDTDECTLIFGNPDFSQQGDFHFNLGAEKRQAFDREIQACRNSLEEYRALGALDWAEGLGELGESRTIWGDALDRQMVQEQMRRRLHFEPAPVGWEVRFQ